MEAKVDGNGSWQNFTPSSSASHPVEMTTFNVSKDCQQLPYNPYVNEENEISLATLKMVVRVVGGGLIPLVCLFGCPINVLNAVVFYKQGLRERINMLLFCLALCDFVVEAFLFVSTIEYFYTQVQGNFLINGSLVTFVMKYLTVLYGFVYVSGFITTLISFERCICVTRPLVAKNFLKTRTMAVIVALTSVVLIVFIYVVSVEKYGVRCGYYPEQNQILQVHYPSQFYQRNRRVMDVLNMVVYGVLLPGFFILTTTITTAITAAKLKGAAHWRHSMLPPTPTSGSVAQLAAVDNMEHKEIALTKMLIAVSCLFVITTIPNAVLRLAVLFVDEVRLGGRKENLLLCGISIVYLANAINSALNFVFYYNMGTRFRECVNSLFSRRDSSHAENTHRLCA